MPEPSLNATASATVRSSTSLRRSFPRSDTHRPAAMNARTALSPDPCGDACREILMQWGPLMTGVNQDRLWDMLILAWRAGCQQGESLAAARRV